MGNGVNNMSVARYIGICAHTYVCICIYKYMHVCMSVCKYGNVM